MPVNLRAVILVIARLTILAAAALLATRTPVASATPPGGLSSAGLARWNFEALLRDAFGDRMVCAKGNTLDFFASGCTPLAGWEPYFYEFIDARHSAYHLSKRHFEAGVFGNYPVPVEIDGHLIACNRSETSFLISYGDAVGLSLGCVAPGG